LKGLQEEEEQEQVQVEVEVFCVECTFCNFLEAILSYHILSHLIKCLENARGATYNNLAD
jgi:hypothetical protein